MDLQKIFSEKTTIDISVVKLKNQKLTKSIFNQLRWYFPFDENINFTSEKILGFVLIGNESIGIGSGKNNLFRFRTEKLRVTAMAGNLNYSFKLVNDDINIEQLVGIKNLEKKYLDDDGYLDDELVGRFSKIKEVVTEDGQKILTELSDKAETFLKEFYKRQILL